MGKFIPVSHFGLTLVFLVTTIAREVHPDNTNITWTSPLEGDRYGPGDAIIGKWDAARAVVSPSFKLCMSADGSVSNSSSNSDDGCGSTVWPTVHESAGSYFISLAVPKVTSEEEFFLEMEDDFGKIMFSPVFTLSPNTVSAQNVGDNPGADTTDTSGAAITPSEAPDASGVPVSPPPSLPLANASAVAETVPATPTATSDANAHPNNPYLTLSRTPPPVAAFVVPLSIVGAILLLAGGLSFHHHRKLGNERARDAEKLDLSRRSSMRTFTSSLTRHSEVKHALDVLAMNDARYGPGVPGFPVDIRRERQPTRQAIPTYAATPIYSTPMTSVFPPAAKPPAYAQMDSPAREDDGINAAATHSVISNYLLPSPIPPSSFLSAPQPLHPRREASLPRLNVNDKPLPRSPGRADGRDVYDAVAKAVGRRIA